MNRPMDRNPPPGRRGRGSKLKRLVASRRGNLEHKIEGEEWNGEEWAPVPPPEPAEDANEGQGGASDG